MKKETREYISRQYNGVIDMGQTIANFAHELQREVNCEESANEYHRKIIRRIFKKHPKLTLIESHNLAKLVVATRKNIEPSLFDFHAGQALESIERLVKSGTLIKKKGRMGGIGWAKDHPVDPQW